MDKVLFCFEVLPLATQKRWYDCDPQVSEAVQVWEELSPSLQVMIATEMNALMEALNLELQNSETIDISWQVSNQQSLGLYQAALKRRWHDCDPSVRKAFNTMALLDMHHQIDIAKRILQTKALIEGQFGTQGDMPEDMVAVLVGDSIHQIFRASAG